MQSSDVGSLWVLSRSLWNHLGTRRRRQMVLTLGLVLLSALSEAATLGAVLPFVGVLTEPETVYRYPLVSSVVGKLGIGTTNDLVIFFTITFIAAALLAGAVRLLLLWISTRLAVAIGADLSREVYRRTLYQPYSIHVARNSSDLISGLSTKLDVVASGVILQALGLVSSLTLIVTVVTALVVIDPVVAVVGVVGFGSCYLLIILVFRRQLVHNGLTVAQNQTMVVRYVQEGMGGIRDILLDGTQPYFTGLFESVDRRFRRARGNSLIISSSPRYVMEAIGMVLVAVLAFAMSRGSGDLMTGLPALAALAIGGQRLLPAMQLSYAAWTGIVGNQALTAEVVGFLDQPLPDWAGGPPLEPAQLEKSLELDSVSFRYTPEGPLVLENLSIEIPHSATVAIVGSTGSGKSTALDLLMGLLEPTSGSVLVDGMPIVGSRRQSWQRNVAYVPQTIFLADASMTENIAFGIPQNEVDMTRIRECARWAAIAEFIENNSEGYDTVVGERGVRLSGGQRQRIGIARAFYKRASILVFDEAMSALDPETERMVVEAIDQYWGGITTIVVSHRLKTIERCDTVFQFANGGLVAQGTLKELMSNNSDFRRMADLSEI